MVKLFVILLISLGFPLLVIAALNGLFSLNIKVTWTTYISSWFLTNLLIDYPDTK